MPCKKCGLPKAQHDMATYRARNGAVCYRHTCRDCDREYERLRKQTKTGKRRGKYLKGSGIYADVCRDPDFKQWLKTPPLEETKAQHDFAVTLQRRYRLDYRELWKFMTTAWTQHWTKHNGGRAPYANVLPMEGDEQEGVG